MIRSRPKAHISVTNAMTFKALLLFVLGLYSGLCLCSPFYGPPDALTSCLAAASVPYAAKNSSQWIQDTKPYNLRLAYVPEAVAIPTTIKHIQDAVKCGRQHGVRVSAKSGGHSYGSFGFGGEDGHLVVVMDAMDKVTMNKDLSCTIQAGARLGHVATELFNNAFRRALPHGTCPG